jgi:hypothetical protein
MSWDYVDGSGIWKRYKNSVTGEDSIKEHEPRVVKQWCLSHTIAGDIPATRLVRCADCGQEIKYVVGYHQLTNGKLSVRNESKQ